MNKIIAFGHRKRVGKDFACQLLADTILTRTKLTVDKVAFADKLYSVCHELYSWDGMKDKEFYDKYPEYKEIVLPTIGKTPRQILIDFGTPAVRNIVYNNTWIDCALKTYRTSDILLISDMRFPNEFEKVKELGGLCIKINRPSIVNSDDMADCALEGESRWDVVIDNIGTPEFLSDAIWNSVKEYVCS